MTDVLVVGAGPAGVAAALRAADLGARTALVTSAEFGGMAANDGPVPVRTLAHAGRLLRDARQLSRYGVAVGEPVLNYSRFLGRVREVVRDVRTNSSLRQQIDSLGVTVFACSLYITGTQEVQRCTSIQSCYRASSSPG